MMEWNIENVPREEWVDEFLNLTKQIPKNINNPTNLLEIAYLQVIMLGELRGLIKSLS